MTKREQDAKQEIIRILQEEGYVTYARLFELFSLNLTKDPDVVGYMDLNKARIVINENLSIDQVSFVVRHEILHEYLDHQLRMKQHMGDDAYNKRNSIIHQIINIAADYEISNRGYTDKDKRTARNLRLGDKVVQGLVTELDHPDWVNMSMEDMYDELMKEYEKDKEAMEQMLKQMEESGLDIGSGAGSAQQEMEDIERQAQEAAEEAKASGDSKDQEQNQKIASAAKKAKEDAEDVSEEGEGSVFDSEEEQKKKEELAKRVEAIKKAFDNEIKNKSIEKEEEEASEKAEMARAAKEINRYKNSPLQKFRISLDNLIKKETAVGRGSTWTRFNKKYSNTGLIKPGSSRLRQNYVPLIDIYYDVSGSVRPYIQKTHEALSLLDSYVRKGKIKVKVYYVSTKISDKENDSTGGGADGDLIMDNIAKTKPDNVIILTDGDADGHYNPITVPGGVYFLFPNSNYIPNGLIEALHGKKLTQTFDL